MAPTLSGGPQTAMPGTTRTSHRTDYGAAASRNSVDGGQQPKSFGPSLNGSTGWMGSNIWGGNGSLSSGLSANTLDRQSARNNVSLLGNNADAPDGRTGSRSLLATSETDGGWTRRSPWVDAQASRRSSGVSPARQRTGPARSPNSQPLMEVSQNHSHHMSNSRSGPIGSDAFRSHSLQLDAKGHEYTHDYDHDPGSANSVDRILHQHAQRSHSLFNGWTDAAPVHSPTDDRRSASNSEYFAGGSSNAASRNGSLPPSRHGSEAPQYTFSTDQYARFAAQAQLGGVNRAPTSSHSSLSNHTFQSRTNSFPEEAVSMLDRLSLTSGAGNGTAAAHRPTLSNVSFPGHPSQSHEQRPYSSRGPLMEDGSLDAAKLQMSGVYGTESYHYANMSEASSASGNRRFDRGAATPGSAEMRSSPYYSSATGTPPVLDTQPLGRNTVHARNTSSHSDLLDQRLRSIAQQDPPAYMPSQYPLYATQRYPSPYTQYPFHMPNGGAYNGLGNPLSMGAFGNVIHMDAPKAPKELDNAHDLRSALLEDFKNNTKSGKRWELKDIYGYIVEFAGDQHGSRFIQQKLETANSEEKEVVFKELQPDSLQLMQDVFGNYVIQKFFEHGDQTQKKILAHRMQRKVFELSKQMYGCRVVQKALEHVLVDQQACLVKELEQPGLVMNCVKDQNGNHVIQKAIECVPAEHIQFIFDTFEGQVQSLAQHTYGCRVIQRMLENCEGAVKDSVLRELHACAASLVTDQYGNYVTQHIIQHGRAEDRDRVVALVTGNLLRNSTHKFASNVVEKCLIYGSDEQRRVMMRKILDRPELANGKESNLLFMIKDQYGNYVIQKMLDYLPHSDYFYLVDALAPEIGKAKRSMSGGKQLLAVEKKMHRFERGSKFDSPIMSTNISTMTTSGASPTSPDATSAAATPPPPLSADALSLRSDSLPSTAAMSAVDEPHPAMAGTAVTTDKVIAGGVVIPQIGITDTSEQAT